MVSVQLSDDVHYATEDPTTISGYGPSGKNAVAHTAAGSNGSIWIDTNAPEREYPKIYRRVSATEWVLYDNTDQSTDRGVLFGNFTPYTATDSRADEGTAINANNLLEDAPDADLYPANMLAVNMAASANTVRKVFREDVEMGGSAADHKYMAQRRLGNHADGSGAFGRLAQRKYIATKMQAAVAGNDDLRDLTNTFTLMCAPNFPELTDEFVSLNTDRGNRGFTIIDAPMRTKPDEIVKWTKNPAATENGDDGLVTHNLYSALYYPSARATNTDGNTVTVPASHAVLYTYANNDNLGELWMAPAGLQRGGILNASAMGYITDEEEFKALALNEGQMDAMYPAKINPITNFPGRGVYVWGQKTLYGASSALDRVNVARLAAYLNQQLPEIVQPLLFESNTERLRAEAHSIVSTFLGDLMARNALYDYVVQCDESNNTPLRIDRNQLWIDIAIEPVKAVEFIYIPVRIVNTGEL